VSRLRASVATGFVLRLLAVSRVPTGMSELATTTVAVVRAGAVGVVVAPVAGAAVLLVYSMAR
jgi:hypothetical protein